MVSGYAGEEIARAALGIAGSCGRVLLWAHGHRIF